MPLNLARLLAAILLPLTCSAQMVGRPGAIPALSKAGHDLILGFEGFDSRPAWPGGASGVTVGCGYDIGYYSHNVVLSDWKYLTLDWRVRLSNESGKTGRTASREIAHLRDIIIARDIGTQVFDEVDVAREFSRAKKAMPGFEDLRPNAQAGLISNGFNRGWLCAGANRTEMRNIRDYGVPRKDYPYIAKQLVASERVWRGTEIYNGMKRRREAEARLVTTP